MRPWPAGEPSAKLKEMGKEIVLVSSGAIAEGMQRLGWKKRPHACTRLQAAAAVGQMGVVQAQLNHASAATNCTRRKSAPYARRPF